MENEKLKKQVEVFTRQLENANKEVITEKEKNATQRQKNEKLKVENKELKKIGCKFKNYCTCNAEKFLQTLTEIKEIAEKRNYLDYNECLDDILQKISEVEDAR